MSEIIRIINTPPGQAPEWVRRKWVGLEFPVAEDAPTPKEAFQVGVRGGKPENLGGYPVKLRVALEALEEKSPRAVKWWQEHIVPPLMPWLIFRRDVCEILPEELEQKP